MIITELIKNLILDAQNETLFTGTLRRLKVLPVEKKATVIIGVRRAGKSVYLNQIITKLLSDGIQKENILYLNFFDDRLSILKSSGPDAVIQSYFLLYPHKKNSEKIYCFFDEIQFIPGWEAFIDRLLRTENCMVFVSGSSAKMLSKEVATQMRGRALSWELFPFSFREFSDHLGINTDHPLTGKQRLIVRKAFYEFLAGGGFPEVTGLDKSLRIKIHQEYFNSILFRDLIERHDISHPRALSDLARKLLDNISSLYTLNSLDTFLRTLGYKVPKSSVAEYLTWFEDSYFLFTVRLYDASFRRSNANPKKVYCIDHALVRSVSTGILTNSGHILENIVFIALRRFFPEIFYYKTGTNQEVDFILHDRENAIQLFQACETLANPTTRQRETLALQNAMGELKISRSTIITMDEEEQILVKTGVIDVVPAWRFLLELEE